MNLSTRLAASFAAALAIFVSTPSTLAAGQGGSRIPASRAKGVQTPRAPKVKTSAPKTSSPKTSSPKAPAVKAPAPKASAPKASSSKPSTPQSSAAAASSSDRSAQTTPVAHASASAAGTATPTTSGANTAQSVASVTTTSAGATLAQQLAQAPAAGAAPAQFIAVNDNGTLWAFTASGQALITGWNPSNSTLNGVNRVLPTVAIETVDNGFSLTYTFTNNTAATRELASIAMPEIQLGSQVIAQDFRDTGDDLALSASTGGFLGTYPRRLYSPMTILRNPTTAVGVSIFYPVLEYRHDVRLSVEPRDGGAWRTVIGLENTNHGYDADAFLFNKPTLAAGQSRSYRVDIRFAAASDWLATADAYRSSFQAKYGAARYTRDSRPISGLIASMSGLISESNPYGFIPAAGRPDLNGYGVLADAVQARYNLSDRVILWTPSGMQDQASNTNYPYLFTSHWNQGSVYGHAMGNAAAELSSMQRPAGASFGLWWGNAASVTTFWNDGEAEALDPSNPAHLAAAFAELDGAVAAGATQIGLDAFSHCHAPLWNLVSFLEIARAKYPQLSFCTEGRGSDILHLHAATWVDAYKCNAANAADAQVVKGRFAIADRLVPGHETWAAMYFDRALRSDLHGDAPSAARQKDEVRRLASLGYVPVVFQSGLNIADVQVAAN